jgi:two-component system, OmpR family, sensor histidine kinase KdpD
MDVRRKALHELLRYLATGTTVLITTFVLVQFEADLEIQLIALLFLVPVLVSTVLWGLIPGVLASFLAFLSFNYYFILPYHTLQIHKTQDLITLIIFLVVSVVISQLIGQAREGMRMARGREWEATRMYELISALAGLQDNEAIAKVLAQHTFDTFQSLYVEVSVEEYLDSTAVTVQVPDGARPMGTTMLRFPLMTARGLEGEMALQTRETILTLEEKRLLLAYTSQGALAFERVRLASSVNRTRVLEESDRMKSSLLSSVSHELRSPLAAIKASVSSLRSGTVDWDNPARAELLETIEEETDSLNFLVGNLLDMSRIESGALKPYQRWNSIGEISASAARKMHKQLQNHILEMNLPETLPLVPTDYLLIEQVFVNLLSNSAKYAPEQTVISISAVQEGDCLHVRVANQGPAVAVEHLERIFEKFHRVTEADRVTGTGLGLSICKGIVEAHGGKIWAANEPKQFAFHFCLPLSLDGVFPEIPKEARDG